MTSQPPSDKLHAKHLRLKKLAALDTPWQLAALAVLVGLLSGLVIILFRLTVEPLQILLLPGDDPENYEALAWWWRLLLPIGGGLLVGLLFHWVEPRERAVGVVHVMERMAYHQGRLPLKNAIMQFAGAAIAIVAGESVGREGPAVHLGAASASQLGQRLQLPNHSIRVLVACGIAGAIAASFNTPLAGVIFSMEVILMEYVVSGFIPVIIASVVATAVCRLMFGSEPAFSVPPMSLESVMELPYILLCGILIGGLAALFIHLLQFFSHRGTELPIWQRTTLAGCLVGVCAVLVPEIMAIGYDTASAAMMGELGIMLLIAILFMKIFATSAGLGLGLPGGLIGPTLIIGACAGGAMGMIGAHLAPESTSAPGLYAMIGMAAMMGATLQAPLAALTALLELTANLNIILPAMLAIVAANLVAHQVFGKGSIFIEFMRARGLDYDTSPIAQSLRRIGVIKAMDREVHACPAVIERDYAELILRQEPHWLVVRPDNAPPFILPGADLARQLQARDYPEIDLQELPAQRRQATIVDLRASLHDAEQALRAQQAEALIVIDKDNPDDSDNLYGVITPEDIEEHYRAPHPHG